MKKVHLPPEPNGSNELGDEHTTLCGQTIRSNANPQIEENPALFEVTVMQCLRCRNRLEQNRQRELLREIF